LTIKLKYPKANLKTYWLEIRTSRPWTVMLSWLHYAYSCPFFRWAILTRKVGHTDLVFGVHLGFIGRSVHARLQFSVCSGYDLFHPD